MQIFRRNRNIIRLKSLEIVGKEEFRPTLRGIIADDDDKEVYFFMPLFDCKTGKDLEVKELISAFKKVETKLLRCKLKEKS